MGRRVVSHAHLIDLVPQRVMGPDYLELVARQALPHLGIAAEAWGLMDAERKRANVAGVAAVIAALGELGWTFVAPEGATERDITG